MIDTILYAAFFFLSHEHFLMALNILEAFFKYLQNIPFGYFHIYYYYIAENWLAMYMRMRYTTLVFLIRGMHG